MLNDDTHPMWKRAEYIYTYMKQEFTCVYLVFKINQVSLVLPCPSSSCII